MIDRDHSTREAAAARRAHDEAPAYEPPTLTVLGSFKELTKINDKTGPVEDPGFAGQPSKV
jgi:hypothetical protein